MRGKFIDLIDQVFGRLYILERVENSKRNESRWLCRCSCGNELVIVGTSLTSDITKSCGCLRSAEETKRKLSEAKTGKNHPMYGKHHSVVARKKMSKSHNNQGGKNNPMYGIHRFGSDNPNYNPNLTDEDRVNRRHISGYEKWRTCVYVRDDHTCQVCRDNVGGNLVAHHLNGYDNFTEERLVVENGITLCETCHKEFHGQYGYGDNTKEQWEEFILWL